MTCLRTEEGFPPWFLVTTLGLVHRSYTHSTARGKNQVSSLPPSITVRTGARKRLRFPPTHKQVARSSRPCESNPNKELTRGLGYTYLEGPCGRCSLFLVPSRREDANNSVSNHEAEQGRKTKRKKKYGGSKFEASVVYSGKVLPRSSPKHLGQVTPFSGF
jgi:hypothetical protein